MGSQGLIIGYHGCDRAVGEKVLSGAEHLRLSENDYDWLGSGIYFWENSATRAMEWAEEVSKNPKLSSAKIRTPFVVGAVIAPGNCLDLLETDAIRIVESSYRRFAETMAALNAPMPKNVRIASTAP